MKRSIVLLAVVSCVVAGLALGSGGVRAGEKDADESQRDKWVEKRIEVIRTGGGSFLGVGLEDVEGDARGARVLTVEPESAAEKAGVADGDVITAFDGVSVRSASQLARLVRETPAGRAVPIEVRRDGAARTLTATLAEGSHRLHRRFHLGDENVFVPDLEDFDIDIEVREGFPHDAGPQVFRRHGDWDHDFTGGWPFGGPRLGVRFIEMGDQLAGYFGLAADEGVLVAAVEEDSPAARAGIQAGDIVLGFGGKTVRDGGDLRSAVREATPGESVAVKVHRKGKRVDLGVTLPEPEKRKKVRKSSGVSL